MRFGGLKRQTNRNRPVCSPLDFLTGLKSRDSCCRSDVSFLMFLMEEIPTGIAGVSKRHRKWKRVYETYDFHPCKPSNVLRDGHMDEVIPLDDFDYGYQTIRYKSHRKGLDGKELIVTVEVPSETPYITCIRDGEQTEGDVYRNPDGSLSLIPWENNPSGKRFPLFDKDGNPDPHISPKEKEANTGRKTRVKEIK